MCVYMCVCARTYTHELLLLPSLYLSLSLSRHLFFPPSLPDVTFCIVVCVRKHVHIYDCGYISVYICASACRMLKLQPETTRLEKKSDAANCSRAKFTGKSHDKRQSQNTLDVQVFEDLLHDHSPELHDGINVRERESE